MIVDVDARRQLKNARTAAMVMLGITVAGFIDPAVAFVILTLNAVIWLGWALDKTGKLHELDYDTSDTIDRQERLQK